MKQLIERIEKMAEELEQEAQAWKREFGLLGDEGCAYRQILAKRDGVLLALEQVKASDD